MSRIGFPVNKTTEWAIKKFIAKITATKDLTLNTALNYIESKVKDSDHYTNFNYKGKRIFFDIDEDYRAIQKIITNILVPRKKERKNLNLKIWNIGCDEGIESYSIAFLAKNYIDNYFSWDKIEIINSGQDYNRLKIAMDGIYPKSDFRKFFVKNFEEFLSTEEDKEIKELDELGEEISINNEVKNMVKIDMRDILSTAPKKCDMIVARNYITDFDDANVIKLIKLFHESLEDNGVLFLSEVESVEPYTKDFLLKEINNRPYFVKV
jgi:two-component system CheB/CheR fusion protein